LERRENLIDAQALYSAPERVAVDLVAITEKAGRRGLRHSGAEVAASALLVSRTVVSLKTVAEA